MPLFLEDVVSLLRGQRTESYCGRITVSRRNLQLAHTKKESSSNAWKLMYMLITQAYGVINSAMINIKP